MDKTTKYEKMILDIISPLDGIKFSNEPDLDTRLVVDKENHRYQVVTTGWDKSGKRVHNCMIHLEIINEKIWIQRNMTEIDPGKKLVYQGIPPSEIVVGFLKPKMRELSDYAVA